MGIVGSARKFKYVDEEFQLDRQLSIIINTQAIK